MVGFLLRKRFFLFLIPELTLSTLILLPTPLGSSNVHISNFTLTDHARVDPFAPCCRQPRRLVLSLFQPAACTETVQVPYMPPATAAYYDAAFTGVGFAAGGGLTKGTFESIRLQTCSDKAPLDTDLPLLIFSTGFGISRHLYGAINQWVAAMGYNIISIDHTYDAAIIEFPDGTIAPQADISIPDGLLEAIDVRAADVSFVLATLLNSTLATDLGFSTYTAKTVGMFGHSLGGATAAEVMLNDMRIAGSVNMDGAIFGAAENETNSRPFLIFASEQHNQSNVDSWALFWQQLKGYKLQLQVNDTVHLSFTDFPIIFKSGGINDTNIPGSSEFVGQVDGTQMLRILSSYIHGFFQRVLASNSVELLQGPSIEFPEVSFQNASARTNE